LGPMNVGHGSTQEICCPPEERPVFPARADIRFTSASCHERTFTHQVLKPGRPSE
jgi:hypothetical protein